MTIPPAYHNTVLQHNIDNTAHDQQNMQLESSDVKLNLGSRAYLSKGQKSKTGGLQLVGHSQNGDYGIDKVTLLKYNNAVLMNIFIQNN